MFLCSAAGLCHFGLIDHLSEVRLREKPSCDRHLVPRRESAFFDRLVSPCESEPLAEAVIFAQSMKTAPDVTRGNGGRAVGVNALCFGSVGSHPSRRITVNCEKLSLVARSGGWSTHPSID